MAPKLQAHRHNRPVLPVHLNLPFINIAEEEGLLPQVAVEVVAVLRQRQSHLAVEVAEAAVLALRNRKCFTVLNSAQWDVVWRRW